MSRQHSEAIDTADILYDNLRDRDSDNKSVASSSSFSSIDTRPRKRSFNSSSNNSEEPPRKLPTMNISSPVTDNTYSQNPQLDYSTSDPLTQMNMPPQRTLIYGQECEEYQIPENLVGLVIGRGGECISRIQNETGCRLQMVHQKTGSQFRPCSLAGTVEQIKAAKGQLDEIVNRGMDKDQHRVTNPGLLGQGGVNETASSMAVAAARAAQEAAAAAFSGQVAPQCTETMIIPANKCGLIIGRNGDTIKNMQMQYKVKMMMIQEDAQTGMDKPLKISGTANSVNNAKMAVLNLVHGQSDGKMQPGMSRGIQSSIMSINTGEMFENLPAPRPITNGMEVFVLQKAVGVIIGKQGEMISKIQRDSGCRIQFTPEDHKQPYRTCVVTGSADGVQVALAQIDDICKNVDQNGPGGADVGGGGGGGRHHDRHEFELSIPSKKVGLIIGKGGESLKYIAHKTGSKIIVDNDHPKEDKYNKIMIITASSEDQAEHARDLIMDRGRLRDSEVRFHKLKSRRPTSHSNHPQNAPGISTNPVALQPNPFGMPNSSPATLNPWASHMSQQTTDSQQQTAVQQYYSQYFASIAQQQALQQQQQAQQKQQQQEGSSPAGGAPAQDYSQQWAEYFKKMNELTKQQEYVAYFQEFYKQSQQLGQPMGQSSDGQNPQ